MTKAEKDVLREIVHICSLYPETWVQVSAQVAKINEIATNALRKS